MDNYVVPVEPEVGGGLEPIKDLPKKSFWKRFSLKQKISLVGLGIACMPYVGAVKIHLDLRSMYSGEHAFILQNDDRRVIFMIPYGELHTLVGVEGYDPV